MEIRRSGNVVSDMTGRAVCYLDVTGADTLLRAEPYGPTLAILKDDGTVWDAKAPTMLLGSVELNGRVRHGGTFGTVVGNVQPPEQQIKAALLLLRL